VYHELVTHNICEAVVTKHGKPVARVERARLSAPALEAIESGLELAIQPPR